jgi:hypothetical protein
MKKKCGVEKINFHLLIKRTNSKTLKLERFILLNERFIGSHDHLQATQT